jgi:hypothetical protein
MECRHTAELTSFFMLEFEFSQPGKALLSEQDRLHRMTTCDAESTIAALGSVGAREITAALHSLVDNDDTRTLRRRVFRST